MIRKASAIWFLIPVFFGSVLVLTPCRAEDNEELGIEMKSHTNVSPEEAVQRSRALAKKYENMGDRLSDAVGLPSHASEKEKSRRSLPKPALKPSSSKKTSSFEGGTDVIMKNGQVLRGVHIAEKDKNGIWVQIDEGAKFYISNHEVKEILSA